jgi:hypothetical protein
MTAISVLFNHKVPVYHKCRLGSGVITQPPLSEEGEICTWVMWIWSAFPSRICCSLAVSCGRRYIVRHLFRYWTLYSMYNRRYLLMRLVGVRTFSMLHPWLAFIWWQFQIEQVMPGNHKRIILGWNDTFSMVDFGWFSCGSVWLDWNVTCSSFRLTLR